MSMIGLATRAIERAPMPDAVTKFGIRTLVAQTDRRLIEAGADENAAFARAMEGRPIAEHADAANDQHYALPPDFFRHFLGPRLKYSCCLYDDKDGGSLAEAEDRALAETIAHADLADGQRILELGCGWGSLTLAMAEKFPAAKITAVSNSAPQRMFIEAEARRRGFSNLTVITADMNGFQPDERFDRVVSVEMFEHMANWRTLLARIRGWLKPDGALFVHVFSHRTSPYRFDHRNESDWIAQHFFTGGIMPSHGLVRQFDPLFTVGREWRWNGQNYAQTAMGWLQNFDANRASIDPILKQTYGDQAALWRRRWRLFFLATAGLFGHDDGEAWGVSHYYLQPRSSVA